MPAVRAFKPGNASVFGEGDHIRIGHSVDRLLPTPAAGKPLPGLTTSQNATAPKRTRRAYHWTQGLTTSQNATAPKPVYVGKADSVGLTTSQNATAPKPRWPYVHKRECLTTSQNATAPKQERKKVDEQIAKVMNIWLGENAQNFGFRYSFKKA